MTYIYFDDRWVGDHGIGRVARVLRDALKLPRLEVNGSPVSPVDPFKLVAKMLTLTRNSAVFSPGFNAPLITVRPYVLIVHDLNHIDCLGSSTALKKLYYSLVLKRACRSAFRVLTVSEYSRQKIIRWAGIPEGQVVNIGNGVEPSYTPEGPVFDPGFPYFLSVSNRKPHKNERRLMQAFASAEIEQNVRLIFTGAPSPELIELAGELKVDGRIHFIGRVPESELPALYRGALALLFPSLYEGFGLPVVEAMACGTPVLTSSTTSLPEVAGDAALLVDPTSIDAIKNGIERLFRDPDSRTHCRKNGLLRARQFGWDAVVGKVEGVLDLLHLELEKRSGRS